MNTMLASREVVQEAGDVDFMRVGAVLAQALIADGRLSEGPDRR